MTRLDQTLLLPSLSDQRGPQAFMGPDSPEHYEKQRQSRGPEWPWTAQSVRYELNSEGYRAPEWPACDWASSTVLFGCSWAFGIGVNEDQTVAHYLSQLLGRPVINVSQGGSSIRWTCDQLIMMLTRGLVPHSVAVIWTETTRWAYYGTLGPDQPENQQRLYLAHAMDPEHSDNRARLDVWGFREQCRSLGIPLAEATWNVHTADLLTVSLVPNIDRARDLQHPGPLSHKAAAQTLHSLL